MPPWSSALAAELEKDRGSYLAAFVEARAALRQTTSDQFPGGEPERTDALLQTDHDQVALVEAGAEALRLQTALERADREATDHEVDTGALLLTQMRELVNAVRARIPSGD